MWLWTSPGQARCGSVAVRRDEKAMYQFVRRLQRRLT
jgi:hypothetical protein